MTLNTASPRFKDALLGCCLLLSLAGCGGGGDGSDSQALSASAYRYDADTVKIASGTVGANPESTAAMRIFKAIPYAAPPLGALRWKPPLATARPASTPVCSSSTRRISPRSTDTLPSRSIAS